VGILDLLVAVQDLGTLAELLWKLARKAARLLRA
jgi:hypothetical protein